MSNGGNLDIQINNIGACILSKQNPDGGFVSSDSTVYETSLAFLALVESGRLSTTDTVIIQNTIHYLGST
jgi:hypothetical protein